MLMMFEFWSARTLQDVSVCYRLDRGGDELLSHSEEISLVFF